jgi:hypothetical protein
LTHNDPVDDDEDVSGDFGVGDRIRFTKFARETFPLEIRASGDEVDGVFVVTEIIKASDGSWCDYALKSVTTDRFVRRCSTTRRFRTDTRSRCRLSW